MKPKLGFDAQQEKRKMNAKKLKKHSISLLMIFLAFFHLLVKTNFLFKNATRKNKIKKFKNFMSVLLLQEIK